MLQLSNGIFMYPIRTHCFGLGFLILFIAPGLGCLNTHIFENTEAQTRNNGTRHARV